MMNRFFTLLFAASCLTAVGQVTYPYNPDGNADSAIGVSDIQDLLSVYGNPFTPSEIMVGDSSLTYWVEQLSQTIQEQQQTIDLLQSRTSALGASGENYYWPLGLGGDVVWHNFYDSASFIVPDGKLLFVFLAPAPIQFELDGFAFALPVAGSYSVRPLILPSGNEISSSGQWMMGMLFDDNGRVKPKGWRYESPDFSIPEDSILCLTQQYGMTGFGHESVGSMLWLGNENSSFGIDEPNGYVIGHLLHEDHFSSSHQLEEPSSEGPCQGELTVNYHGYDYELVEIGDQCWFAENVRFLPRKATSGANVNQGSEDNGLPYSYVYGEDSNDLDIIASSATLAEFGALYNFQASIVWDLCPSGWHIPSDADWMTLEAFVGVPESELTSTNWRGTEEEAGKKLKSIFWSGTDEYGFGALPGGARYAVNDWQWSGGPGSEEPYALFMTSSFMNGGEVAIAMRSVRFDEEGIWRGPLLENPTGLSVRCIKDAE